MVKIVKLSKQKKFKNNLKFVILTVKKDNYWELLSISKSKNLILIQSRRIFLWKNTSALF